MRGTLQNSYAQINLRRAITQEKRRRATWPGDDAPPDGASAAGATGRAPAVPAQRQFILLDGSPAPSPPAFSPSRSPPPTPAHHRKGAPRERSRTTRNRATTIKNVVCSFVNRALHERWTTPRPRFGSGMGRPQGPWRRGAAPASVRRPLVCCGPRKEEIRWHPHTAASNYYPGRPDECRDVGDCTSDSRSPRPMGGQDGSQGCRDWVRLFGETGLSQIELAPPLIVACRRT